MAGQAVGLLRAGEDERGGKVVPGGVDGCRVADAGFHRGDDGGELRAWRNCVDFGEVLKEHLEVFGQANA